MPILKDNNHLLLFGNNSERLFFRELKQSDFAEWMKFCEDPDSFKYIYSLMPEARGKGYALEAAKKCRDNAFENNLSESLISIIHIDNKESEKVAIRNGMKLDKTTTYNNSSVNIFRIKKSDWKKI